MFSRAVRNRKEKMLEELAHGNIFGENAETTTHHMHPDFERRLGDVLGSDLLERVNAVAVERNIHPSLLIKARVLSLINAHERGKVLSLKDVMPYGQYKGMIIEDMIMADPRYVNYLASVSDIFVLDEAATALLSQYS